MAKNLTKETFQTFTISIAILWYLEAKFDYVTYTLFYSTGSSDVTQNVQVILSKIAGVTLIFGFLLFFMMVLTL